MSYSALIVGLGQIGMGYDYDLASSDFITSHAKAVQMHPDFELVGGVDPLDNQRDRFSKKYGKPAYKSLPVALKECSFDLAIVSTPTKEHVETVKQLLEAKGVRLILCEKPLANKLADAKDMLDLAKRENTTVAVNYTRRYDPGILGVLKRLKSGELGFPIKACVWYGKGIFNNGSHFLNLLSTLMGETQRIKIISKGRLWDGWDPEPDVKIIFEKGEAYFLAVKEENFSYSQIEFIGPKGKVNYGKGNRINWWVTESDPLFPGYTILQKKADKIPIDLNRYQYHVLQNLSEFLRGRNELLCDGNSGFETMQILNDIQKELV